MASLVISSSLIKTKGFRLAQLYQSLLSNIFRNYILGQFLRSVDGPFALADKFKAIWEYNLDYSYFDLYFNAIKTVTPNDIIDLANKYLQEKDLLECVVGKNL